MWWTRSLERFDNERSQRKIHQKTYSHENHSGSSIVPLLVAVLIMGGIGFWLFEDFDHLYPGPSGNRSPSGLKPRGPPIISPQGTALDYRYSPAIDDQPTAPTPSNLKPRGPPISSPGAPAPAPKTSPSSSSSTSSSGGGDCSANPACNELDLTGQCCPTGEGVMLGCCSS
jgi:hypothetical protein